ncbi:hypothetical protein Syun_012638 [Stephania yunnanensis]|uniref:Uncharacterized protein n=1 Tax=Stephania yunnanensis TaxID=152371 RepID=A0AAP0K165_9MAGN
MDVRAGGQPGEQTKKVPVDSKVIYLVLWRVCTGIKSSELVLGLRFECPLHELPGRKALQESAMPFVPVHRGEARADGFGVYEWCMKGNERDDRVTKEESHDGNEIDRDDDDNGNADSDGDYDDVGDEDEDGREEGLGIV